VETDDPEFADDRGHSAHHPGYRRRQLRFLTMKLFSQLSSYLIFLALVPVLRHGPNKLRFPYSIEGETNGERVLRIDDTLLTGDLQFLSGRNFRQSLMFVGATTQGLHA
jgi:hypothetical protein